MDQSYIVILMRSNSKEFQLDSLTPTWPPWLLLSWSLGNECKRSIGYGLIRHHKINPEVVVVDIVCAQAMVDTVLQD
jgi:hypothetical protein